MHGPSKIRTSRVFLTPCMAFKFCMLWADLDNLGINVWLLFLKILIASAMAFHQRRSNEQE